MAHVNAPWAGSVTPVAPPPEAIPHTSTLVYAGIVTGAWSGLLSLLVYGLGRLLGVPFEMVTPFGHVLGAVPWYLPLLVPLVAGVLGGYLSALALGRPHAGRIVFWAGTGIALLSCIIPLAQSSEVLLSSRLWLLVPHLITWFLVVPQLARIVADSEPGMTMVRA